MSVRNGKPAICWFSRGAFVVAIAALPIGLTACTGSSLTAARLLASNGNAAGPHKPIIIDEAAAPEPHQQRGRKRRTTASAPRSTVGPAKTADAPRNTASSAKKVLAEARTLRLAGRRDDALRLLNTAASAHPDNIAISQQRALLTLEVGDIDRAERLLRKVVAKSPGDWRLHSALGAALAAKGNHKAAVVAFGKALKLSPGQPAILNNLAMSHAMAGNLAKAEQLLRKIASNTSNRAQRLRARQNLALVLGWRGKHDEAHRVAASTMPVATADANAAYLRRLSGGKVKVSRAPQTSPGQRVGNLAPRPGTKTEAR